MLQELGYEIVDEDEEAGGAYESYEPEAEQAYQAQGHGHDALPSYDLEEMRAADVSAQYADDRQVKRSRSAPPFADTGALPSFPLDEPDADYAQPSYGPPDQHPVGEQAAHQAPGYATVRPAEEGQRPSMGPAASMELEDALDEAEFF